MKIQAPALVVSHAVSPITPPKTTVPGPGTPPKQVSSPTSPATPLSAGEKA
ncbi:unnamed protein product [Effrenium voratum]|nr:unnamed protein product [Effrenium voratum]